MNTQCSVRACALLVLLASGASRASPIDLTIETPSDGAVVRGSDGMAFVAGKALGHAGGFATFDIVFVLDQSSSTRDPAGADVNGDGTIDGRCAGISAALAPFAVLARSCPTPGDSIFAAELAAVRALVAQLDPRTTRVGLVSFSGDGEPGTPDAVLAVALSADHEVLEAALQRLEQRGPQQWTNLQAAVALATRELSGGAGARSRPRAGAQKIVLLLTDGAPTLPLRKRDLRSTQRRRFVPRTEANRRLAVQAAREARKHGIRIDTYGVGAQAHAEPETVVEIARATQGIFTPVFRPAELQSVFEHADFSELDELRIWNRTTSRSADCTARDADGSFSALLAMQEGENTLEVYARTRDGSEQRQQVTVTFVPGGDAAPLEPGLVGRRNRALRAHLEDLRTQSLTLQGQRDEALRRSLARRIQGDRRTIETRARKVAVEVPE